MLAIFAVAALVATVPIEVLPHFACPMKSITGLPCMTCGGTRAVFALGRLEMMTALRFNPLVTVLAVGVATYVVTSVIRRPWRPRWSLASKVTMVVAAVANWAYLVIDGR